MSDVLVLCYHAVSERWPAALSIPPEEIERQLAYLVGRGYRGATFHDAVTSPPAGKTLAVTFDDAYRSVIARALPILNRLGLPGTVFAPTGLIGIEAPMSWPGIDRWVGGPHEEELVPMSWVELRALAEAGWEIGSHTRSHPRLTRLADRELAGELRGSREDCAARLDRPCRSLSYPYGDEDGRVVAATREAGYSAAGTLPGRLHPPSALRWSRIGVYRVDRGIRFRLKASPRVRRLRTLRAWAVVTGLRSRWSSS